jgi:hypothetical protein
VSSKRPSTSLSREDAAELKAHHLACSQLVRGCQDAVLRLRGHDDDTADSDAVSYRAVEIMESVLASWCETLSVLRSAMGLDATGQAGLETHVGLRAHSAAEESTRTFSRFARSVFAGAYEREHARP